MKSLCGLILGAVLVFGAISESHQGAEPTQGVNIGTAVTIDRPATQCVIDSCEGIGWQEEPDYLISSSR